MYMYSRVRVWRTLEYALPVCGVRRPTRVWRTLESMVTAVAMDSRVQKLPRVRGGSYTGPIPEVNRQHRKSYFDRLKKFFDEWGFKMSTTKTVAVEFRRSGTQRTHLPLNLGTSSLIYKKSVSSSESPSAVISRGPSTSSTWPTPYMKRPNLMRAMAGSHWGASKDNPLMVYRALIRSAIDYESASRTRGECLNIIQCKAYTIASRELGGTSSGVDKLERSGTPFLCLLFSRNARSGTYCQISRNAFCLPFRHLLQWAVMMIMYL